MKAKLIVNGKELEVEISEEELKKFEEKQKKTGYERVEDGQVFYYDIDGTSASDRDVYGDSDRDGAYIAANYYSDEIIAENNIRADKLMRQLRRLAAERRKEAIDYKEGVYEILYDQEYNRLSVEPITWTKFFGAIPFDTKETALLAIDTFRDELIWYFTEYKDSL